MMEHVPHELDSSRLSNLLRGLAEDGDFERVMDKLRLRKEDVADFARMAYEMFEEHVPGGCDGDTGLPSSYFHRRHLR